MPEQHARAAPRGAGSGAARSRARRSRAARRRRSGRSTARAWSATTWSDDVLLGVSPRTHARRAPATRSMMPREQVACRRSTATPWSTAAMPLEPGAGVDRRLRAAASAPRGVAVELHEDQIPDLDEAAAVAGGIAVRRFVQAAGSAEVDVDLASRGRRGPSRPSTRSCGPRRGGGWLAGHADPSRQRSWASSSSRKTVTDEPVPRDAEVLASAAPRRTRSPRA